MIEPQNKREGMSEISETEIKSMTEEQNYTHGYKDDKSDVFDEMRAEIDGIQIFRQIDEHTSRIKSGIEIKEIALEIIDKYKTKNERRACDDCISRQTALDLKYRIDDSTSLASRDVVNADDIEDLSPVVPTENVRHWIPVNERLPEKDGWYLVTTEEGTVETAYYKRSQDEDFNGWYSDTILAWLMMLPEPYKVESEDK